MSKKATEAKEDFDLDDFRSMTDIDQGQKTVQPRPKTSEHVIKISDDGQERPKSVRTHELTPSISNGHINGTVIS